MTVSTGIYTYPFEVELPESLPTSCEGKYGFIRYLASVNIVRPSQPVQTQTVPFTVIKTHNLNASPLFQVSRVWTRKERIYSNFLRANFNRSLGSSVSFLFRLHAEPNKEAAKREIFPFIIANIEQCCDISVCANFRICTWPIHTCANWRQ